MNPCTGTSQRSRPSRTPSPGGLGACGLGSRDALLSFDYQETGGPSGIAAARVVNRDAKFWKHADDQGVDVRDGLRRAIERAFNSTRSTVTGLRLGWGVRLT